MSFESRKLHEYQNDAAKQAKKEARTRHAMINSQEAQAVLAGFLGRYWHNLREDQLQNSFVELPCVNIQLSPMMWTG